MTTTSKDDNVQSEGDKDNADDNTLDEITPRNSDDEDDDKTAKNLQKPDTTKGDGEKDQKDDDTTNDGPTPDDKGGKSTPIENKKEQDKDDSEVKTSDADRVKDVSPSSTTENEDETLSAESGEIVSKDPEVPSDNDKDSVSYTHLTLPTIYSV